MHGASGRQILGQRAPLAAGAQNVHHAVDHLADSDAPFAAAGLARRDQRLDMRPFRIGQVARITQFVAVVARGGCRQSTWGTSRANSPPQRITADSALQEGPPDNRFIRLIKSPDGHSHQPRPSYITQVLHLKCESSVVLLLNILAYELVHARRCLMETATGEGWSLRRFRERVLRAAARVVVSGDASPWSSGKHSPDSGTGSGRAWNACDTPTRNPVQVGQRDFKPPPDRRWRSCSPPRRHFHAFLCLKWLSHNWGSTRDSPAANDAASRLASHAEKSTARRDGE